MKTSNKDILDVLIILAKHKKSIIIPTIIVSIFSVVYILLVPEYWTSYAKIRPETTQTRSLAALSADDFGIPSISSSFLGSAVNPEAISFFTVLNSRTFSKKVIDKFNLINYFEIEKQDPIEALELAIKRLNNKMKSIGLNQENNVITIKIESKDRKLSADIANFYWKELEKYNLETRMTKAKRKRIFLEERLSSVKTNIDSLTLALNRFKNEYDVIEIDNQRKLAIDLYSNLASRKIDLEIKLEFLESNQNTESPIINEVRDKLEIVNTKLSELESKQKDSGLKYNISLDKINDISSQYLQIYTQLEIQKKVYEMLYPLYEQAKIEEVRDLPTVEVIDKADIQGLRSSPKRAVFCIIMFLLALILSSAITYISVIMKRSERDKKLKKFIWYLFHKSNE